MSIIVNKLQIHLCYFMKIVTIIRFVIHVTKHFNFGIFKLNGYSKDKKSTKLQCSYLQLKQNKCLLVLTRNKEKHYNFERFMIVLPADFALLTDL